MTIHGMSSKRRYKEPRKVRVGKVSFLLSLIGTPAALILWIWGIDVSGSSALVVLLVVMPLIAILSACSLVAVITGSISLGLKPERKLGIIGLVIGALTLIASVLGFQSH